VLVVLTLKTKTKMSKEDNSYIVFAEDSTAMMQESLIQQSNPLTKEKAIEFAERIKDRDNNLFCVTILKRVTKEEEIIKDVFEWLSKMDYLSDDMDILLEEYINQNKDE
jgi:hypothetical protein